MQKFSIAVVGGGAAGIVAGINAKRKGSSVVICEKMSGIGKKLLASGNGRCNLSNDELDESYYNLPARPLVSSVLAKFGPSDIKDFFERLGLELHSQVGRVFPATNQAASVLKVLELELKRLDISCELNFDVASILTSGEGFMLTSKTGKKISCRSVIVAGGGKSYPAFGSDGSAYRLAGHFGHRMIEPVPVAVGLIVKDSLCHYLQGQRILAAASSIIDGKIINKRSGELLFTKYGLSGTAILDISEEISIALNRNYNKDVEISIDMVPFMEEDKLKKAFEERLKRGLENEDVVAGILPNKFGVALKDLFKSEDAAKIASLLKNRHFKVAGTRSWNEAEFTAGGVDTSEVKEGTLESNLKKGLYFAGEILDVNGMRGGYNLAWAWASGFVAGAAGAA